MTVDSQMDDVQQTAETLRLPPILDLKAAAPLREQLMGLRGKPVELDGADVQRLGGLCLQVLLSARDSWSNDGLSFSLGGVSEAFDHSLSLFGVRADEFQTSGV